MLSPLEEEEQKFDSDDSDDCKDPVGNGNLATRMRISKSIPQFLPMLGRKIRVYYRGITKLCINCYKPGHIRKDCTNQTVGWIAYVESFMQENTLDDSFYGNWKKIVEKIKHKEEMDEQRKRLVEEVKEMAGSPGKNPPRNGRTDKDGEEGGRKNEGREPTSLRRSTRSEGRKGEKSKVPVQARPEEEDGGGAKEKAEAGSKQSQNLKEKAIAAKNKVDSRRKNSI